MGTMMSLSVFLQPIVADRGWSVAGVSATLTINFLCMGIASFAWGALSDRFGARFVVLAGGVLLGAGLVLASQTANLGQFQVLHGVIVGVAAGSAYAPMVAVTAGWFTAHRSLAVALVSIGLGIGSMTVAPFATWMIGAYDWRTAMLVLGLIAWGVVVPLSLLIRRPPPEELHGATPAAVGDGSGELTVAQALRSPQFAAIALTHFACCAAHSGPIFHMVNYALSCGMSKMAATTVFSAAGFGGLGGRIVCALVADKVGAKPVLVLGLAVQALAVSLYLVVRDPMSLYALAVLFGLAYGGVMPLYAILVRQYFGARIMGTTFGAVAMVSTLGMALGPWAGGVVFDAFTSYAWLYIGSFAFGVGAVVIALTFRPPRPVLAPSLSPAQ
jgi:MFS family permease